MGYANVKKKYIITGTDTGIGKTLVSALLMRNLDAAYWKPIQSGLEEETDTEFVKRVSECGSDRIIPEKFRLNQPLSPHLSAAIDGVEINPTDIKIPEYKPSTLIIEGAGGVLVPINWNFPQIELFRSFNAPVVIVSRTKLGTINHTLLTVEALRNRGIPIHGVVFSGEENTDNFKSIETIGNVKVLGWIPQQETINGTLLDSVFKTHFNRNDW